MNKSAEKSILIIGNGFDIKHGLATKYIDYMNYVKDRIRVKPNSEMSRNTIYRYFSVYPSIIDGWIDFETALKMMMKDLEYIFENVYQEEGYGDNRITNINRKDTLFKNLCESMPTVFEFHDFSTFSLGIHKEYSDSFYKINKRKVKEYIRQQFEAFLDDFSNYLLYEYNKKETRLDKQIQEIQADRILSFNYTRTYEKYGYVKEQVFHVHGSLDDDNIVIGYNDDKELELDFVYFKKYYQTVVRKIQLFGDLHCVLQPTETSAVLPNTFYFYGHSLDITDEDKLQIFFNDKFIIYGKEYINKAKYVIFYHSEDDREIKIINLIKLIGKEKTMNYIYSGRIKFKIIS